MNMKKIYLTVISLGITGMLQAQDTYLNERMINSGSELYGTSRYVGMGGSMGALGADLSCMSYNPAGIGLYRRSDISMTAGAQWNTHHAPDLKNSRGTFDQIGCVITTRTNSEEHPYLSIGVNFQKKINFGQSFIADNSNLKGLSQMDQLADMANGGFGTNYNITGAAIDYQFLTPELDQNGNQVTNNNGTKQYFNKFNGEESYYSQHQWGGLNTFDVNISGNYNDRIYWGVTAGFESLKYHSETDYYEKSSITEDGQLKYGDYSLYNNTLVDGWGFNMKFGLIARPIEDSPLRLGVAFETPTWYQLTASTLNQLYDEIDQIGYNGVAGQMDESYLEYSLRNPAKGRFSIGSSVSNYLLWNIDYEIANYKYMNMGYPKSYSYDGSASLFNNEPDRAMNQLTKNMLGFQHSLRAGIEVKPTTRTAVRLGYNYSSSPYKDNVSFDQYSIDSYAMDYMTRTSYWRVGDAHTITLGLGYRAKHFYIDMAYKVRGQKADFYAFDDTFNQENPIITNNGTPVSLDPVEVNLGRQNFTCTLGFKF